MLIVADLLMTFIWVAYFTVSIFILILISRQAKRVKSFHSNMADSRRLQLEADNLFESGEREKGRMKLEAAHAALERAKEFI